MNTDKKEQRDRVVALAFVAVLLLLVYGPGAPWFVAADRVIYDQTAARLDNAPLERAAIISVNPSRVPEEALLDTYGQLVTRLKAGGAERIVLANPPAVTPGQAVPAWVSTLAEGPPVFLPRDHPMARFATRSGYLRPQVDRDGVMRRSQLWHFESGAMFPSLPLAIALQDPEFAASPQLSGSDTAIYLSNYQPLPRYTANDVLRGGLPQDAFAGQTVFVDADPPLVTAAAKLPSGQYVTLSEITAALLASIEHRETIVSPGWIRALEWLAPALLAIAAVLFLPGRPRREIALIAALAVVGLLLVEILLLAAGRIRLDLGRALLVFVAGAALSAWLTGAGRKAAVNAFKRGADFLAAGRLEPAFAEFRRCEPTDMLATLMYKLSLAFEEQAKPERAEAVLQWMKRSHTPRKEKGPSLRETSEIPQRLGRYVIEKKLGRGAMGAVYLARDPRINRAVALKVIPIEKEFEDEELKEARLRFFREAESAGRLTHPGIITVFDAGEDKGLAYIAMEYLPSVPLTNYTETGKLLPPKKALELCAQVAETLDYAHGQGVIHRDIKPANLLYNLKDDMLKVSDFGVARLTDNNRTKTGIVLGTPMYMSPEQLGAETLTGHSDLFSLGVTLYELLVGEVPFKATNIAVLMTKITSEDPAPVSNRRAGVPPSTDAALAKALAKKPAERFANGAEMAAALRNCARYASSTAGG